MTAKDVLQIYNHLAGNGIPIWIDGGWCVDALLGRQTREHSDLDIAVDRKNADRLKEILMNSGFKTEDRDGTTDWNYVIADEHGKAVDVHVFELDENGGNIYGVEYPGDSLTGMGTIAGQTVRCIAPEWMFKFKTAYAPKQKDVQDVQALSEKYGFEIPATHR